MKAFTAFVRAYYERVLAVLVMITLIVFSVILLIKVNALSYQFQQDNAPPGVKIKPANLKEMENAVALLDHPPVWELKESDHNIFIGPTMKEKVVGQLSLWNEVEEDERLSAEGFKFGWLRKYGIRTDVKVGSSDPDGDGFTNREEYDANTNPNNASDFPDLAYKLRWTLILKREFPFVFMGEQKGATSDLKYFVRRKDGKATMYPKIGEEIKDSEYPGYKVIKYTAKIVDKEDPHIKEGGKSIIIKVDESELVLQKEGEAPVKLIRGQSKTTNELYVKLFYIIKKEDLPELALGSEFEIDGKRYRLEKINNEKGRWTDVVIVGIPGGKEFSIKQLTPEEKQKILSVEGDTSGESDSSRENGKSSKNQDER